MEIQRGNSTGPSGTAYPWAEVGDSGVERSAASGTVMVVDGEEGLVCSGRLMCDDY